MAKRKKAKEKDENQIAASIIDQLSKIADENPGKDALAVLLGRRGGLKGGKARAESLSPERRSKIASDAVKARWAKAKERKQAQS